MTAAAVPWPPALAGTPAVSVIEKAIGRGRLSHSLMLAGDDPECLSEAAMAIADRLLRLESDAGPGYPPDRPSAPATPRWPGARCRSAITAASSGVTTCTAFIR